MNKLATGLLVGSAMLVGAGTVDIVPVPIPAIAWYQYHVSDYRDTWTETTATGTVVHEQLIQNFPDDNGDGLISYAVAINDKGENVYTQIPDAAYALLGQKNGGRYNLDYPSVDKITVAEAIIKGIVPNTAQAAVGRLSSGTWTNGSSASSQTIPITISAGTNAVLSFMWVSRITGLHDISSILYNGSSMGAAKQSVTPSGNAIESYSSFIGTTDGSAHNIVINYSPNDSSAGAWESYSGVDQTGFDNTKYITNTTSGNISDTVTVNTTGSWVTCVTGDVDSGAFTAVTGLTAFGGSPGNTFDSNSAVSAGTYSMTINRPSGTRSWLWSVFVLKPAADTSTVNNSCRGEFHGTFYCKQ